jgi:CO/xanthine dehydrogenase FAD-binding subunit
VRRFELAVPGSVGECLQILAKRGPDTKVVAGGTDLLPQLKNGVLKPGWVVDLSAVAELRTISDAPDGRLRIGASVTARELELDARVRSRFPALAESAAMVGSVQVRNLATLGGNLCNAAPSADMAPPLLALDAEAVIAGPSGQRRVPMTSFFLGVRRTVLAPGELLLEIVVPAQGAHSGGNYLRHTPRRELDIAVVGVASQVTLAGGKCTTARIALAAVAPVPLRARDAEQALVGQPLTPQQIERAAELASGAARPIDDHRGSIEFRNHLVRVLTRRTLTTALQRASR